MKPTNKKDAQAVQACRERIAALNIDATVDEVIAAVAPLPARLWLVVDNEIGNGSSRYGDRGCLVRRVRNCPTNGPRMFAAMK